ncbi:MAG: hypothetical protein ABUL62_17105 [Myxococcales bacterium]
MQPTPTNDRSEEPENLFDAPAPPAEATFREGLAADPQGDRPRSAKRSVATWLLPLLAFAALAVIAFAAFHRQPANDGKLHGPGDEAAPSAPVDGTRR